MYATYVLKKVACSRWRRAAQEGIVGALWGRPMSSSRRKLVNDVLVYRVVKGYKYWIGCPISTSFSLQYWSRLLRTTRLLSGPISSTASGRSPSSFSSSAPGCDVPVRFISKFKYVYVELDIKYLNRKRRDGAGWMTVDKCRN